MIERIAQPDRRPEKNETLEKNIRDQVDLRLRFAEAVSQKKRIPLQDALRDYTDFHVRLTGDFPGHTGEEHPRWESFAGGLAEHVTHEARLDYIANLAKGLLARQAEIVEDTFSPFRYDYSEKDHTINLHFGTLRPDAGDPNMPGVLSRERFPEMREKLRQMFTEIKQLHPDPEHKLVVRGASWLYNREAYRRLYPAAYTAHPRVRMGKFTGGGTWGQFRDKTGAVKLEEREQFLRNIEHLDPDHLEDAFPYKTLLVSAPIEEFYKEYGIE